MRRRTILKALGLGTLAGMTGGCDAVGPAYQKLIGLNLVKKFRDGVKERLGGVQGCTHITEMLAGLPTAAIQSFAGEMREERPPGRKPFQLDHCHAMDTGGETVKKWYPEWYAAKEKTGA